MVAVEVSEASIRALAGAGSFETGTGLVERVEHLAVEGTAVRATVGGTRVDLTVTRSGLTGRCTCPEGVTATFCAHRVATALHWLRESSPEPPPDDRWRTFLLAQEKNWLVDQLVAAMNANAEGLRDRLRRAVETNPEDAYFSHIHHTLEDVDDLIDTGFPETALALSEYAMDLLENSTDHVDDPEDELPEAIAHAEEVRQAARSAL
ncbi:hypothetical protein GCM10010492_13220 [Saccharothrix mutabilis subsp. mutabilis]|uniref:SWIM-type domain-containing protein n=1 Tax=Saccharothrix mutabilis subsp. mutabilis TaxID=66855 RepID=A0ABN0TAH8_9PSEU